LSPGNLLRFIREESDLLKRVWSRRTVD